MRHHHRLPFAIAIALAGAALLLMFVRSGRAQETPAARLHAAWRATERAGRYTFSTTLTERTLPAPRLTNAGQGVRARSLYVQGASDRAAGTLDLQLWDDAGQIDNPAAALAVRVQGSQTFGRVGDGAEWQPLDDLGAPFAPTGDAALFLNAAENVRPLGSDSRALPQADGSTRTLSFERYAFTLNSADYARMLRDQLQAQLQRQGGLPRGIHLGIAESYANMTAAGEAWIDGEGRPLRLTLTLEYPQAANGERTFTDINTTFTGYDRPLGAAACSQIAGCLAQFGQTLAAAAARFDLTLSAADAGSLLLAVLALAYLLRPQRGKPHPLLGGALAVQLAFAPLGALLDMRELVRFVERHNLGAQFALPGADALQWPPAQVATAEAPVVEWSPTTPPAVIGAPAGLPPTQTAGQRPPVAGTRGMDAINAGEDDPDADRDGLTDAEENLGWITDPNNPDHDGDGVADGAEVDGCSDRNAWNAAVNLNSPVCADPYFADTDGDGLTDGDEINILGTFPREVDTDHDGITDYAEARGFVLVPGGQRFYPNPRNPDSDNDGLPDGVECPALARPDANSLSPWSETLTCPDLDGDGSPDLFDIDNDGDGIPNRVDSAPYSAIGRNAPFSDGAPLKLTLEQVAAARSVYLDLQIVPANPAQLGYAFNILDWPSNDHDGQVRRAGDTTFGDTGDTAADAFLGDMRLAPMLEIILPGNSQDVPRKTAEIDVPLSTAGMIVGSVLFQTQPGDDTLLTLGAVRGGVGVFRLGRGTCQSNSAVYEQPFAVGAGGVYTHTLAGAPLGNFANGQHIVQLTAGGATVCQPLPTLPRAARALSVPLQDPGVSLGNVNLRQDGANVRLLTGYSNPAKQYNLAISNAPCSAEGSAVAAFTNVASGATRSIADANLVDIANGAHALRVYEGNAVIGCSTIGNVVNGTLTTMIDQAFFDQWQITIHDHTAESPGDSRLVAVVPLSPVIEPQTGMQVGFGGRLALRRAAGSSGNIEPEVRLIWTVSALTDSCIGANCAFAANDRRQVIHTYRNEPWFLAGLSLNEDGGGKAAVIHQDVTAAVNQQDPAPEFEDYLWHAARGLTSIFLGGIDCAPLNNGVCQPNGVRDVTVNDLFARLDADGSVPDGDARRWGIPKAVLQVTEHSFANDAELATLAAVVIPNLLTTAFGTGSVPITGTLGTFPTQLTPNLLIAREDNYRSLALDASAGVAYNAGQKRLTLTMSQANAAPVTTTSLSWAPYRYVAANNRWESYPIEEYWRKLELLLSKAADFQPIGVDGAYLAAADIFMTQVLYLDLYRGKANAVQIGALLTSTLTNEPSDDDARLEAIAAEARTIGAVAEKGALINKFVEPAVTYLDEEYELYKQATRKFSRKMRTHLDYSLRGSIGRSLVEASVAVNEDFLTAYRPEGVSGFRAKLHTRGAVGLQAVAVMVGVGTTVGVALSDRSTGAAIEQAMASLNLALELEGSLGVLSKWHTFQVGNPGGSLRTFASTLKASSSAVKAALIGLVISQAIALGVFIYTMDASGIAVSSLQFRDAFADLTAGAIVAGMFAALASTGIGALIVAIIGLIDALIFLICNIANPEQESFAAQWVCIGISGLLAELVAYFIYDQTDIVTFDDASRLAITGFDIAPIDLNVGFVSGMPMAIALSGSNTIGVASFDSPLSLSYGWQFNTGNAKQTVISYSIASDEPAEQDDKPHTQLVAGAMKDQWQNGSEPDSFISQFSVSDNTTVVLPAPGLNAPLSAYLAEAFSVPVQECALIPILPILFPPAVPVCWVTARSDTNYLDLKLTFDVFPPTLDGFRELTPKDGGYALAWGQSGVLTFPMLLDADGDGLPLTADFNDSLADSDGDGLSDLREGQLGTSPGLIDTDADGVSDADEVRAGSNPLLADSDQDGLSDGEELAGWMLQTSAGWDARIFSDPSRRDQDGDQIIDSREKAFGLNPAVYDQANLLDYTLDVRETGAPILMLPLDEPAAPQTFKDVSTLYSRHGASCVGDVCPLGGVSGRVNNAAVFDGVDDMLTVGRIPALEQLSNNFTVAAYIYPERVTGLQRIMATSREFGVNGFGLGLANDELRFTFFGVYDFDSTNLNIQPDRWTHVQATVRVNGSNTEVQFVIDAGIQPGETIGGPLVNALPAVNNPFLIGGVTSVNGPDNFEPFDGRIDEVVVYANQIGNNEPALATYKLNDGIAQPGDTLALAGAIRNRLNSRSLYGLVNTTIPAELGSATYAPENFVLAPTAARGFTRDLTIGGATASGTYSVTQAVGAIVDLPPAANQFLSASAVYEQPQPSSFDGSSAGSGALKPGFSINSGDFTIATWVLANESGGQTRRGVLGWNSGEPDAFPSIQISGFRVWFGFGTGSSYVRQEANSAIVPWNTWTHVAVSFDRFSALSGSPAVAGVYINGTKVQDLNFGSNRPASTRTTFDIGRSTDKARLDFTQFRLTCEAEAFSDGNYDIVYSINGGAWQNFWQFTGTQQDPPVTTTIVRDPIVFSGVLTAAICEDDNGNRNVCAGGDDVMINLSHPLVFNSNQAPVSTALSTFSDRPLDPGCFLYWAEYPDTADVSYELTRESLGLDGSLKGLQIHNIALDATAIQSLLAQETVLARFKLDERPSMTRFADEVAVSEGTCSGANCPTSGVRGRDNMALFFDGANDYVRADRVSQLAATNIGRAITFGAWIKPRPQSAGDRMVVGFHTSSGGDLGQIWIRYNADGSYRPYYVDNVIGVQLAPNSFPADEWTHIMALISESGAGKLYINGFFSHNFSAATTSKPTTNGRFTIGGDWDGATVINDFFHGSIDDVYIARRELGLDEVFLIYRQPPYQVETFDYAPETADHHLEGQIFEGREFPGPLVNGPIGHVVNLHAGEFTLTAWVLAHNTLGADNYQPIISTDFNARYFLGLHDGKPYANFNGVVIEANQRIPTGIWTHLAFRRNADSDVSLYINGQQVAAGVHNNSPLTDSIRYGFGRLPGQSNYRALDGRLDEVAFYTRAVSAAEIYRNYYFQNTWLDETRSRPIVVDGTPPTGSVVLSDTLPLTVGSESFDVRYIPAAGAQLVIDAADTQSALAGVFLYPTEGDELAQLYELVSAPPCSDARGGTRFCPFFAPNRDGVFLVGALLTDTAGNANLVGDESRLLIADGTPPYAFANGLSNLAFAPQRVGDGQWVLRFSGHASDPAIVNDDLIAPGTEFPGSGVRTVLITVFDANGNPIGSPAGQLATLSGATWTLDYLLTGDRPAGNFDWELLATDNVGNSFRVDLPAFTLDSIAPQATTDGLTGVTDPTGRSSAVLLLNSASTLTGSATERPTDGEIEQDVAGVSGVQVGYEPLLAHGAPAVNAVLPNDLLLYLPLDEFLESGQTSFRDLMAGRVASCTPPKCPAAGVAGRSGQALAFDGAPDGGVLRLDHFAALGSLSGAFSVGAWVRPTALTNQIQTIVASSRNNSWANGFNFGLMQDGLVLVAYGTPVHIYQSDPGVVTPGVWQHVAVYVTTTHAFFYVNNRSVGNAPLVVPLTPDGDDKLLIGGWDSLGVTTSGNFNGSIDEVQLWNGGFNTSVFFDLLYGASPLFHLPFDDEFLGPGSAVAEASGLGGSLEFYSGNGGNYTTPGRSGAHALRLGAEGATVLRTFNAPGAFNRSGGPFTLAFWLYNGEGAVFFVDNPSFSGELVMDVLADQWRFFYGGDFLSAPVAGAGWHHYAVTWDGGALRAYVDGAQAAIDTTPPPVGWYSEFASLFFYYTGSDGALDDLRGYPRALSDGEIAALAAATWSDATITSRSPHAAEAAWSATVPDGLEGFYNVRARGADAAGNVDPEPAVAFRGMVDTLAPRAVFSTQPNGNSTQYEVTFTDFNLDATTLQTPVACQFRETTYETNYTAAWYLALANQDAALAQDRLYELAYVCYPDAPLANPATAVVSVCDTAGNCTAINMLGATLPTAVTLADVTAHSGMAVVWPVLAALVLLLAALKLTRTRRPR